MSTAAAAAVEEKPPVGIVGRLMVRELVCGVWHFNGGPAWQFMVAVGGVGVWLGDRGCGACWVGGDGGGMGCRSYPATGHTRSTAAPW